MPFATREDFEKGIEKLENKQDILDFLNNSVKSVETKFTDEHRAKNNENKQLKESLKGLKTLLAELGWDESGDSKSFIETLKATLEGKKELEETSNKEVQTLKKTLEKIQKDLKTEQEQRATLQKQNKIKTIESVLMPKFNDSFYGANFIVKSLISDSLVDLDDSGNVIFKDGDSSLGLDEGIKKFSDSHPESRKNTQKAGSGSKPSGNGAKPKYTIEQLNSMTPAQAAADIEGFNASLKAHATAG